MATEAVELLLECMTALSSRALHTRQTTLPTEVVQSWSECEMLSSTEEIEPWSVCETTLPTEALPQCGTILPIEPLCETGLWTEAVEPSPELATALSIEAVESECETALSTKEIEPECELTVPDEAIKPPSKSKPILSSQPLSTQALECEIILLTKVVESLPECQATFSTEQIELLSEFEEAWSIVSNRALP